MTPKHTPGPWWLDDAGFICAGENAECVTIADFDCTDSLDIDEREANKALAISAPKMLIALKALKARIEGRGMNPLLGTTMAERGYLELINAAITGATTK